MSENEKTPSNSKLILIIAAFLFLNILVLYYLFFTQKPNDDTSKSRIQIPQSVSGMNIAFVNTDSLFKNYAFFDQMETEIKDKRSKLETQLTWSRTQFEKEAQAFYEKAQTGGFLTRESMEQEQLRLAEKEQQILQMSQNLSNELAEFELEWNNRVLDTVNAHLKKFNIDFNYDYILGYAKGGGILFANDSLDITKDVLNALNQEYGKPKNKEKEAE